MEPSKNIIIAISRQIASGGSFIAQSIARKLGFKYLDRDILYGAAETLGVNMSDISGMEEKSSGFLENVIRFFSFGTPESAYIVPTRRPVYDRDLFNAESAIIRKLAANNDCVILGRGGAFLLGDHPGILKVFLHAPRKERVKRLMDIRKSDDCKKIAAEIDESDENRGKFMFDMLGTDWNDARNHHLCIDTSATGLAEAEEMILKLAGEKIRQIRDEKICNKS